MKRQLILSKGPLHKDFGFTLVEVMVAMGLMAVAILAITSMMEMNSKAARNTTQQSDAQNLATLIQMDMNVSAACNATILNIPPASLSFAYPPPANLTIPVTQVLTGTVPAQTIAAVGQTFNSVVLNGAGSLSLQNFIQTGASSFLANLVINATAVGSPVGSSLGNQNFVRKIPVSLLVNIVGATATITGCPASSGLVATYTDKTATYSPGTTYPNPYNFPLLEYVTMTGPGGCAGDDNVLTGFVNMVAVTANSILNDCAGSASVNFIVPAGATFSVQLSHISSGGPAITTIANWQEVTLAP